MGTLAENRYDAYASDVWFDAEMLHVRLLDGRQISVPIDWFPRLRDASDEQRKNWKLIGKGIGIRWDELDEDVSIAGLLKT